MFTHALDGLARFLAGLVPSLPAYAANPVWPAATGPLIVGAPAVCAPVLPVYDQHTLRIGAYRCRYAWGRKCCWPEPTGLALTLARPKQ
jgi:hypothetical protein